MNGAARSARSRLPLTLRVDSDLFLGRISKKIHLQPLTLAESARFWQGRAEIEKATGIHNNESLSDSLAALSLSGIVSENPVLHGYCSKSGADLSASGQNL